MLYSISIMYIIYILVACTTKSVFIGNVRGGGGGGGGGEGWGERERMEGKP